MEKENTIDEFFKGLPDDDKEEVDIFDEKKPEVKEVPKEEVKTEEDDTTPKERRYRRLEKRYQEEREANIALAARAKALSEMDKFSQEVGDSVHPDIAKMFDSSEVGKENALRLSKVLKETRSEAKEEAIREFEERQTKVLEEQKSYEKVIDNELESLEDKFNVDLTSDSPKARKTRREFLELIQKVSPKDESGEIIGYADFDSTFDMYQKTKSEEKVDNSRREEIADRSMRRSTSNTEKIPARSRGFDGWKTDYQSGN